MSKRNTFLDADEEEEDERNVHSDLEDARDSRFSSFNVKRRKLSHSEDDDDPSGAESEVDNNDEDDDNNNDNKASLTSYSAPSNIHKDVADGTSGSMDATVSAKKPPSTADKPKNKILTQAKLEKAQRKLRKTGVIYISRVPPFMKPSTLRQLLLPYGTILRIFLTPEPAPRYQARVRAGGNKKKSFIDGWVEFESKMKAKICVEALNGNIIGGKKGGFYHDDIWNMKYLKGFKWNDLMEQVQGEDREREGRLQAEIERERRERKIFLQNVERAKVERGMEAKRKKKAGGSKDLDDALGGDDASDIGNDASLPNGQKTLRKKSQRMEFKQNLVRSGNAREERKTEDAATSALKHPAVQ